VAILAVAGCSRWEAPAVFAQREKLFQPAPPSVKTNWDNAIAAYKIRDYAGAEIALTALQNDTSLSPEQKEAVDQTFKAVNDDMYEAVRKNDPKGFEAMGKLKDRRGY
jgi:hypothetical protein